MLKFTFETYARGHAYSEAITIYAYTLPEARKALKLHPRFLGCAKLIKSV